MIIIVQLIKFKSMGIMPTKIIDLMICHWYLINNDLINHQLQDYNLFYPYFINFNIETCELAACFYYCSSITLQPSD